MNTVAFTGHRPKDLAGYVPNNYLKFNQQFDNVLYELYKCGVRRFISGGAQGFDQLAFWRVDCFKMTHKDIENIVYVPFKGQEDRWLKDGFFSQAEYHNMLRDADKVVYLSEEKPEGYGNIAKALMQRNERMVDDADIVVALYEDDSWTTAKGGTAEAMRYAHECGKLIYQLPYIKGGWYHLELKERVLIDGVDKTNAQDKPSKKEKNTYEKE